MFGCCCSCYNKRHKKIFTLISESTLILSTEKREKALPFIYSDLCVNFVESLLQSSRVNDAIVGDVVSYVEVNDPEMKNFRNRQNSTSVQFYLLQKKSPKFFFSLQNYLKIRRLCMWKIHDMSLVIC